MSLREQLEGREAEILSSCATLARNSRGRATPEQEHEYRTAFQRDRDRILHTNAFRRLKRKTQVFVAPASDHYRTRLTHTLEVSQIARTIARALRLNEDLVEAISLGHDLGHTPFGHAGEAVLDEVSSEGFRHWEQSLRIVEKLESTSQGPGLNLTWEVRDGIFHHSYKHALYGTPGERAKTVEGDVVSVSDAIAYINHDIDDAIRAGVITMEHLPKAALARVGAKASKRINTMTTAVIEASQDGPIDIDADVREAILELREYLYRYVYPSEIIDTEIRKAKKLLKELYYYHIESPTEESAAGDPADSLERRTIDFIAGMTDHYALNLYTTLFHPRSWP